MQAGIIALEEIYPEKYQVVSEKYPDVLSGKISMENISKATGIDILTIRIGKISPKNYLKV
jgi:hypothetical protein